MNETRMSVDDYKKKHSRVQFLNLRATTTMQKASGTQMNQLRMVTIETTPSII